MKIGMNLPVMVPGLDRDLILEWSRRVDAGPYASLAAGERITFPNPEMMVTLAAAAAVTERVRLAFNVLVLPMHSAVLIAKQVATLDVISAGRVTLGVGVGGREEDYRAVGVVCDEKRLGRLEEQVGLMRRAWAGEQRGGRRAPPGGAESGPAGRPRDSRRFALSALHPPRGALGRWALRLQLRSLRRRGRTPVRAGASRVEAGGAQRPSSPGHRLLVRAGERCARADG